MADHVSILFFHLVHYILIYASNLNLLFLLFRTFVCSTYMSGRWVHWVGSSPFPCAPQCLQCGQLLYHILWPLFDIWMHLHKCSIAAHTLCNMLLSKMLYPHSLYKHLPLCLWDHTEPKRALKRNMELLHCCCCCRPAKVIEMTSVPNRLNGLLVSWRLTTETH